MKRKLLARLLALCLVFSLLPMGALADFSDTEGHWGKESIDRWASVGVLNGKSADSFDPDGNMTRAEFAQMLCNLMGYTKKAANTFTDIPDDAWYADAMLKLVEAGIIGGVGNNMAAPNAPITREQAAVMLCRAFNIKASSASLSFADAGNVSSWARDSIAALTELGMMNGVGNNQVAPQLNINRASVAKLIDNMVAEYVTESKTITGTVDGIIIVAAGATVTLNDAEVTLPVIVAPKAEDATVAVTGSTTVDSIVVGGDGASVTVGADAKVDTVDVNAADAAISGSGAVANVNVGEDASNAKVTTENTVVENNSETPVTTVDGSIAAGETETTPEKEPETSGGGGSIGGGGGGSTAKSYNLDVKVTNDKNVSGATLESVKIGNTGSNSAYVKAGSTVKVTIVCKKNIAAVLASTSTGGTIEGKKTGGNAEVGFTYEFTIKMPNGDASLVVGILNACDGGLNNAVGISACNAGENDDLGAILTGTLTGISGEFGPDDAQTGGGGTLGGDAEGDDEGGDDGEGAGAGEGSEGDEEAAD